jgi:ribosome-associated protein
LGARLNGIQEVTGSIPVRSTNSKSLIANLRIDIGRSSLPPDLRERLIALAGRHVTADGVLVVVSRVHRSQVQNRHAARARLVALLKRAAMPPKKRKATKPSPAAREMRLVSKERQSAVNALGVGEATISGPGAA